MRKPKSDSIRVSAKHLSGVEGCPRCFYIQTHAKKNIPYSIFPSVFIDFDVATKKAIHSYFDSYGKMPNWLNELGPIEKYLEAPHWSKLSLDKYGIIMSGSPDGLMKSADGKLMVLDYKTAHYKGYDDPLFRMYEVQMNAYAFLLELLGHGEVGKMALIYMHPSKDASVSENGLNIEFVSHILEVQKKLDIIEPLMQKAAEILYGDIPLGKEGCKECENVVKFGSVAR